MNLFKNIIKKSYISSICLCLFISLALSGAFIGSYTALGSNALRPTIAAIKECGKKEEHCQWEKWKDDEEEENTHDVLKTYDGLVERFPDKHQGVSLYSNYISNETLLMYFSLIRNVVLAFVIVGVLVGIALHLFFGKEVKKSTKKKTNKK